MIKNAFLAALFFLLVGLAWLLDGERSASFLNFDDKELGRLLPFDAGEAGEIRLPQTSLILEKGKARVGGLNWPADQERLKRLLEKLSSIHAVKELEHVSEEDLSQYFSRKDLELAVKSLDGRSFKARLGDVSEVTGNFYFQILKPQGFKVYVAEDRSFFEGLYKTELEASLKKYLELKDLIAADKWFYAKRDVFSSLDWRAVSALKIDNKINRWFKLDLDGGATVPAPPAGIKTLLDRQDLKEKALGVRFEGFVPAENNTLAERLSSLEIVFPSRTEKAALYGKLNGKKGLYLSASWRPELIFELRERGSELFFENVQAYWLKKPFLGKSDLSELKSLNFSLGPDLKRLEEFEVEDLDAFEIKPKSAELKIIRPRLFNLVFNALFGSNSFEQAKYVNALSPAELKAALSEATNKVYLKIFGKVFVFAATGGELALFDLEESAEFRYELPRTIRSLAADGFFAREEQER